MRSSAHTLDNPCYDTAHTHTCICQEVAAQAAALGSSYGGAQVSHVAHLGGATAGVMLMWALSKLPEADGR